MIFRILFFVYSYVHISVVVKCCFVPIKHKYFDNA